MKKEGIQSSSMVMAKEVLLNMLADPLSPVCEWEDCCWDAEGDEQVREPGDWSDVDNIPDSCAEPRQDTFLEWNNLQKLNVKMAVSEFDNFYF